MKCIDVLARQPHHGTCLKIPKRTSSARKSAVSTAQLSKESSQRFCSTATFTSEAICFSFVTYKIVEAHTHEIKTAVSQLQMSKLQPERKRLSPRSKTPR
jgi:hypothetical protein